MCVSALFDVLPRGLTLTPGPNLSWQVPASVKEGIEIAYVENVGEVIRHAFAGQPIADRVDELRAVLLPREEAAR